MAAGGDYHTRYRIALVDDLATIGRAAWNALVAKDPDANLFVRHEFLHALHARQCAIPRTGWAPQYLTLWRQADPGARDPAGAPRDGSGETLAGAVPLYAKGHSFGEYVFDWGWADAYERTGRAYYPKWLAAVPFTPVGGSRLIAADNEARAALARALVDVARGSDLSSLHLLFAPPAQIELLAQQGLLVRSGVQFHWRNRGYADFDAFLAAMAQPKRKKIRAERRHVADAGVTLRRKSGRDITKADWDFFFRCYRATYAAHHSTPYLTRAFFGDLAEQLAEHLLLVIAEREGRPIAAAFGVFDEDRGEDGSGEDDRRPAGTLWGRHWGAIEHVPLLHFECCYYQMIEFAIERRLAVFEGGAQGAHKMARGLDPVRTQSVHWIADPAMRSAVERFLAGEGASIDDTIDELNEHRAWRTPRAAIE